MFDPRSCVKLTSSQSDLWESNTLTQQGGTHTHSNK